MSRIEKINESLKEMTKIIKILNSNKYYTKKDMEKAFVAGGKSARNIENDSFDEFIEKIK